MLGQPGRAGCVGMWLVGPVGGRFWSGYLWMGCFCWLDQNFCVLGGFRSDFQRDVPYPRGSEPKLAPLARLRASTQNVPPPRPKPAAPQTAWFYGKFVVLPPPPALGRAPNACIEARKPVPAISAFSQCFRIPPPPRGLARLTAGLVGLEPRFDRCAAPLDVVYTFIWPGFVRRKKTPASHAVPRADRATALD